MTILVVGASGFLGANIALAASADAPVVRHRSADVDLRVPGSGERLVEEHGCDVVVNCAALADVDRCEREPELARRLNAELPGELSVACARTGAHLVHISTDAVFGAVPGPYAVGDPTGPTNAYGSTKLDGERAVLDADSSAAVVRTNIVGWSPTGRRSLLEFFVNRLAERQPVSGFVDAWFRPVAASDLWSIVGAPTAGIVHATGADLVSKYDFGVAVAARFGYDPSLVRPGSLAEGGLTAPRGARMDVIPSIDSPPTLDEALCRLLALDATGYRTEVATWS